MQAAAAQQQQQSTMKLVKGRKDSEGQEAVIKTKIIRDRVDELVELHGKAVDASEVYADAVKKAAEESGLLASVVRKFVAARAGERFEEERRKVEQLSLVFEEVGE